MITPAPDRYGPEADRSQLADWLELLALADTPLGADGLADVLRDTTWTVRSRELFHDPAPAEPTEDLQDGGAGVLPPEEEAEDVMGVIEARAALLGTHYPFALDDQKVRVRSPPSDSHQGYLELLAITAAHHHGVICPTRPHETFEALVADAIRSRGLQTSHLGAHGRVAGSDFRDVVRLAGIELGLATNPVGAPSRQWAKDEDVDVVGHLAWGDTRPGHWTVIGQVTVGRSSTWNAKIKEPMTAQWSGLLSSLLRPAAFLAIPHHCEDEQLYYLTYNNRRMVLDRPRLARHLAASTHGQGILRAVLTEGVFSP